MRVTTLTAMKAKTSHLKFKKSESDEELRTTTLVLCQWLQVKKKQLFYKKLPIVASLINCFKQW